MNRVGSEEFAREVRDVPGDVCVHEQFEIQAKLTPDAIAVIDGDRFIDYAALDRRVDRLASTLQREGVGPDVPVGLLCERSLDAVTGILGILKAGGAYVPINPREPDDRIGAILEDSGAPVVLVGAGLGSRLRAAAKMIELGEPSTPTAGVCRRKPGLFVTPENLAAIVYTSGTTGTPKGVEIPHRAIMARVRNGYSRRRHDLQKAPLSVVAHFSDLLLPLISGGPVIFVPDAGLASGRALLDVILHYGTTRMVFVPSQLRTLLEGGSDAVAALGRLDSLIVSGEALSPSLVADFKRLLPHVTLVNAYGASEVAGGVHGRRVIARRHYRREGPSRVHGPCARR